MFRRRNPRSYPRIVREALWPRGGWSRAISYMRHRVQRLPDPPHKIARGMAAGVFAAFTPLYGLHFFLAYGLARLMRGNGVAGLIGTFFGNPLTYLPIAWVSLVMGHWMLGTGDRMGGMDVAEMGWVFGAMGDAARDLWHNVVAAFGPGEARWHGLRRFWRGVFLPWSVGGIVPGVVCGLAAYYVTLPAITAYQTARRSRMAARLAAMRDKAKGAKAKAIAAREAKARELPARPRTSE